jgi:RNA polymerase sigma-70 factor (ECF subfamily)
MDEEELDPDLRVSPLSSPDPRAWERLIEQAGPAAIIVRIQGRMGPALLARLAPEDVWQETLLHAWRDRERHEWKGLAAFKGWLVSIAENRIRDALDLAGAQKRGALAAPIEDPTPLDEWARTSSTPSRHAAHREEAAALWDALQSLPEELREVLRLRLFEGVSPPDIARRLDLGLAAVKHRLRRGSELYRSRLATLFSSHAAESQRKP